MSEFTEASIVGLIWNVNQSDNNFLSDVVMQVKADIINFPFVRGRVNSRTWSEKKISAIKYSIMNVSNDNDFNCLPRSLCYVVEMVSGTLNGRSQTSIVKALDKISKNLCKDARIVMYEKGCALSGL